MLRNHTEGKPYIINAYLIKYAREEAHEYVLEVALIQFHLIEEQQKIEQG